MAHPLYYEGKMLSEIDRLAVRLSQKNQRINELEEEVERFRIACSTQNHTIEQTLGKALGYPWFKDDLENWPDATEADGVCVGEHVAETLAVEAARRIGKLEAVIQANHEWHLELWEMNIGGEKDDSSG